MLFNRIANKFEKSRKVANKIENFSLMENERGYFYHLFSFFIYSRQPTLFIVLVDQGLAFAGEIEVKQLEKLQASMKFLYDAPAPLTLSGQEDSDDSQSQPPQSQSDSHHSHAHHRRRRHHHQQTQSTESSHSSANGESGSASLAMSGSLHNSNNNNNSNNNAEALTFPPRKRRSISPGLQHSLSIDE